jgi:DNA-binding winged helix-turn-helix (wHTH) protein
MMRLRFGDCVFDASTRQIQRHGHDLPLPPKAFQLLQLLIRDRPRAISKQQLQDALWPDTFVAEANLANLVADLRAALGDHAKKPHIIRTVQRFGYAFQAHAEPEGEAQPGGSAWVFRLIWDDREIALQEGANILGRDDGVAAWIDVYSVSRQHARLMVSGEKATLEDLNSKNGTFVAGTRISGPVPLADGTEIRIGTAELVFRCFRRGVSTGTARGD